MTKEFEVPDQPKLYQMTDEILSGRSFEFTQPLIDAMRSALDNPTPEQLSEIAFLEDRLRKREIHGIPSVHARILASTIALIRYFRVRTILDVGCGEGLLLYGLANEDIDLALGIDISTHRVKQARAILEATGNYTSRLSVEEADVTRPGPQNLVSWDAAALVEVIEHLEDRSWIKNIFELKPGFIIVTTPNKDANHNLLQDHLTADGLRHADHKFEFTKDEFEKWAEHHSLSSGYLYKILFVEHPNFGPASQIAIFKKPS